LIQLKSFAKINLCLYVLRKREDGFHDIYTVMQAVDLHDRLSLYKMPRGIVVQTDDPKLPADKRNLAYKAAEIFLGETKIGSGVKIKIQKRIPLSSGLGGGSSNAAFTLIGLNRLFNLGLQTYWIVLIKPPVTLSTPWVYENFKIDLTKKRKSIKIYKKRESFFGSIVGWENELEKVAVKKYPQVKVLRRRLEENGAIKTSMSGSGPAVYGIFFDKPRYKEVRSLRPKEWQIWVTRPIPLLVL